MEQVTRPVLRRSASGILGSSPDTRTIADATADGDPVSIAARATRRATARASSRGTIRDSRGVPTGTGTQRLLAPSTITSGGFMSARRHSGSIAPAHRAARTGSGTTSPAQAQGMCLRGRGGEEDEQNGHNPSRVLAGSARRVESDCGDERGIERETQEQHQQHPRLEGTIRREHILAPWLGHRGSGNMFPEQVTSGAGSRLRTDANDPGRRGTPGRSVWRAGQRVASPWCWKVWLAGGRGAAGRITETPPTGWPVVNTFCPSSGSESRRPRSTAWPGGHSG